MSGRLFCYPLPPPEQAAYRELGVEPDASNEEVSAAKSATLGRLQTEKAQLEKSLQDVYDAVPGLRNAYQDLEGSGSKPAVPARPARDQGRLVELEGRARRLDPDFRDKRQRAAELATKLGELNQQALEKPASRLAYDRAHPPLALLKLEDCATDDFVRGPTCLYLLRKDIAQFLAARGESVFHPSDLTRDDFLSDFAANPLLDGSADE